MGTPDKPMTVHEVEIAQQRVGHARACIQRKQTEMTSLKNRIVICVNELRQTIGEHDMKLEEVVTAESDLAKWRATLTTSGFCKQFL